MASLENDSSVVEPETVGTVPAAATTASGRQGALSARRAAASGRGAAATSTRGKAVSSRRVVVLSPEELAARREALRRTLVVSGSIVGGLLVVVILMAVLLHTPERVTTGQAALDDARRSLRALEQALNGNKAGAAVAAFDAGLKTLTGSAELGFAAEVPADSDRLVKPLAFKAYDLRQEIQKLEGAVQKAVRTDKALNNRKEVMDQLGKLAELDSAALAALGKLAADFLANPVDPAAGPNEEAAREQSALTGDIRVRMADIAAESKRRQVAAKDTPVAIARSEAETLIKQERFQAALDLVAEAKSKNPQADFRELKVYVDNASAKGWSSVETFVKTKHDDWSAAGSTVDGRAAAKAAALERLDQVIERFGIATHVEQAKALKATFE